MKPLHRALAILVATGAGALGAVLLDPRSGNRRRARAWQLLDRTAHGTARGLSVAVRDLQHRVHGIVSVARGVSTTHEIGDDVVVARVRSRLGHACSYPQALRVTCKNGIVELGGPVLQDEVDAVLDVARGTLGARQVSDRLERHAKPGYAPGLQGTPRASRPKRGYWTPATRLLVGGSGAIAAIAGLSRGSLRGIAVAAAGAAAIARSLANVSLDELGGFAGHRPAIDVEKSISIHAPVEHVFELFARPDKLAQCMRHVERIERIGESRWRWNVKGPAGTTFEWEGLFDRLVPNELVAWKSAEDASVRHEGSARFERTAPGTTRLTVRLRYWPPAGLAGHELARLFGDDPKREIEEDLMRLKSLLEEGKTRGANGVITLEEVRAST